MEQLHIAPPPPCFAWSPSPAAQGRIRGAVDAPFILRCEAGEGNHEVVEGAEVAL
jgi:hypothetical protein